MHRTRHSVNNTPEEASLVDLLQDRSPAFPPSRLRALASEDGLKRTRLLMPENFSAVAAAMDAEDAFFLLFGELCSFP